MNMTPQYFERLMKTLDSNKKITMKKRKIILKRMRTSKDLNEFSEFLDTMITPKEIKS